MNTQDLDLELRLRHVADNLTMYYQTALKEKKTIKTYRLGLKFGAGGKGPQAIRLKYCSDIKQYILALYLPIHGVVICYGDRNIANVRYIKPAQELVPYGLLSSLKNAHDEFFNNNKVG